MKPDSQRGPGGRDTPAARPQPDRKSLDTPDPDMQAEDAGTGKSRADSGAAQGADSGTAATRVMKQTSKTSAESSDKR